MQLKIEYEVGGVSKVYELRGEPSDGGLLEYNVRRDGEVWSELKTKNYNQVMSIFLQDIFELVKRVSEAMGIEVEDKIGVDQYGKG